MNQVNCTAFILQAWNRKRISSLQYWLSGAWKIYPNSFW